MILFAAWAAALGVAVLADLMRPSRGPIEIRACVVVLQRILSEEDGVIRVAAEIEGSCARLVVDCSDPPDGIPGILEGYSVRIRLCGGGAGSPAEEAARRLVRSDPDRFGVDETAPGRLDQVRSSGREATVRCLAPSPEIFERAKKIAGTAGAAVSARGDELVFSASS